MYFNVELNAPQVNITPVFHRFNSPCSRSGRAVAIPLQQSFSGMMFQVFTATYGELTGW